jgi:hypothetical protein
VQKGQFVGTPPLVKDLKFTSSVQLGKPAQIIGRLEDSDKADKLTLPVNKPVPPVVKKLAKTPFSTVLL